MSAAEGGSATLLVVDDEPANVMLLERLLGRTPGWNVVGVTRSAEAIQRFLDVRPDLVLLDLHMPPPDGFAVLEELRRRLEGREYLPVIVLTADATRQSRERALSLGASDFLTKPLDAAEVVLRVRNLLEIRALHRRVANENERLEELVRERTRALADALEVARAAARAKDQFLANVSHELRTPLTAVRGAVGLLAGPQPLDGERVARLAATALRNAERLERLIQDVLLLQSLQSGELVPTEAEVHVGEVVQALVQAVDAERTPGEVELRAVVPADASAIRTDREMLAQVLRRLVDNALRFTSRGSVTVEVDVDPSSGRPRAVRVTDTGPGIAVERHEAIFRPFEQIDNSDTRRHGGLGVGLTIARAICDLLGFAVSVRSAPGGGACFVVELGEEPRPPAVTAGVPGASNEGNDARTA